MLTLQSLGRIVYLTCLTDFTHRQICINPTLATYQSTSNRQDAFSRDVLGVFGASYLHRSRTKQLGSRHWYAWKRQHRREQPSRSDIHGQTSNLRVLQSSRPTRQCQRLGLCHRQPRRHRCSVPSDLLQPTHEWWPIRYVTCMMTIGTSLTAPQSTIFTPLQCQAMAIAQARLDILTHIFAER